MTDLKSIVEAVRINFAEHYIITWDTNYTNFDRDSEKIFPAWINYEIAGSYIHNNQIKIIVSIKEFSCSEYIIKRVLRDLEEEVKSKITERIPETNNKIEIVFEFKQKMLQLSC
jgi:hypothetical protein